LGTFYTVFFFAKLAILWLGYSGSATCHTPKHFRQVWTDKGVNRGHSGRRTSEAFREQTSTTKR